MTAERLMLLTKLGLPVVTKREHKSTTAKGGITNQEEENATMEASFIKEQEKAKRAAAKMEDAQ